MAPGTEVPCSGDESVQAVWEAEGLHSIRWGLSYLLS